jgi:antitoxin FitA
MADLLVRKLDDDLVRRLKARAQAHGRSAEAEHRAILEQALRPARTGAELWEALRRHGPVELDLDDPALHQIAPDVDPFE